MRRQPGFLLISSAMEKIEGTSNNTGGLKFLVRALHYRNYRLFFIGQGLSLIGTWMQIIAVIWTVYDLTNSAVLLGVVAFCGQIPTFLLAPLGGVAADKWSRRRILLVTQSLSLIQALILAALALSGHIQVWHIIALSILLGLINAFDVPCRQAFVLDMIEKKEDIVNAIALNSSMFNGARLIGPSIAGILIASVGAGICFLINALSFLAVLVALGAMRIAPKRNETGDAPLARQLKEGLAYAFGMKPIRDILLLLSLVSLFGLSYPVLMPIFAIEILGGDARTLGFLMAAIGIGALLGTLQLALQKDVKKINAAIYKATFIFGACLVAFSFSRQLWLSLIFLFCVGFGLIVQMASSNTVLQSIVSDDKRGRVMSLYTMAFMGMSPFSSLLAGFLATKIGAPSTIFYSGLACILGGLFFRFHLRRW